jgi:hypothetical protein
MQALPAENIFRHCEGLQARGNPDGLADCSGVLEGCTAAWIAASLRSSQ